MSDDFLDIYLTPDQLDLAKHVAPDKISDALDVRDAERAATVHKLADQGLGPLKRAKPVEIHPDLVKKAKEEQKEFLMDTATRMNQDEAVHELEKIDKKERF